MKTTISVKVVAGGFACLALALGFLSVLFEHPVLGGFLILIAVGAFVLALVVK